MQEPVTQIIADWISTLLGLLGIGEIAHLLNLLIAIAAIIWLFKRVFRIGSKSKRRNKQSDDWLTRAQAKQEIRFQNSLPPLQSQAKPQKKSIFAKYNESKGKSATGWTFNEETQLWEPPKKLKREANKHWKWDEKKQIWIDLEKHK